MKTFLCEVELDGKQQRTMVRAATAEDARTELAKTYKVLSVTEVPVR